MRPDGDLAAKKIQWQMAKWTRSSPWCPSFAWEPLKIDFRSIFPELITLDYPRMGPEGGLYLEDSPDDSSVATGMNQPRAATKEVAW